MNGGLKLKRIAFVLERLSNGGAERVTAALANCFANASDVEVHVFTYVKELNEYGLSTNVTRHNMDNAHTTGLLGILQKSKYLHCDLNRIKPDYVISLATPRTSILLWMLNIKRNFRLILSERNDPNRYPKSNFLKMMRNIAYRYCEMVVFQTSEAKNYFSLDIQNKSVVIPNPITENLPERFRGTRRKSIVNFCRLEEQKNLKLLIYAFSLIKDSFPDYKLEIYGNGPLLEDLIKYSEELNVSNDVVFYGFSNNIHERIVDASIYVSSSNYEGMSNSMIEALALGIPTICTDCPIGGAKMLINSYENGILTPVGDSERLSEAMKVLLQDKSLMKKLSENGSQIRNKLDVKIIAQRWMSEIVNIK